MGHGEAVVVSRVAGAVPPPVVSHGPAVPVLAHDQPVHAHKLRTLPVPDIEARPAAPARAGGRHLARLGHGLLYGVGQLGPERLRQVEDEHRGHETQGTKRYEWNQSRHVW